MGFFKRYAHTFLTIGMISLTTFTPALQTAIAGHPLGTAILTGVWAVIGHLLPSPLTTNSGHQP